MKINKINDAVIIDDLIAGPIGMNEDLVRYSLDRWKNTNEHSPFKNALTHTCADGREIPIFRLELTHLLSIIKYHSMGIAQSMRAIGIMPKHNSMLDFIVQDEPSLKEKKEMLKRAISHGYITIGKYLMETMRRGKGNEGMAMAESFLSAINELEATPQESRGLVRYVVKEDQK